MFGFALAHSWLSAESPFMTGTPASRVSPHRKFCKLVEAPGNRPPGPSMPQNDYYMFSRLPQKFIPKAGIAATAYPMGYNLFLTQELRQVQERFRQL